MKEHSFFSLRPVPALGLALWLILGTPPLMSAKAPDHTFQLGTNEFLLDGKPFQMRAGEIDPGRIPRAGWRQRIRLAKAMGLNTIAVYLFWSYHEPREGRFDFKTRNRDLAAFFRIAQEEGMWVFLRPGPYACAEYDFGGMPPYLLHDPNIRVRCMNSHYTEAVRRYFNALAKVIRPWQVTAGGPILMMQIENEYGSYANDREYMEWLRRLWRKLGITIPFSTGDGATRFMLEAGSLPGCAVGLDPGTRLQDFALARRMNPGVPVFTSELYPGWLTHWGESWARVSTANISRQVKFLMDHRESFNLYIFAGGTSFGFEAGANANPVEHGANGMACSFQPDITSYDYDAPVNEQGQPTPKYWALRKLIASYLPKDRPLAPVPPAAPAMAIPPIQLRRWTTLWDNLPKPVKRVQPESFEALGQYHGLMLYRTTLIGRRGGRLVLRRLHDFALVFLDGKYLGAIDRRQGQNSIQIPPAKTRHPVLDILVEAMGHINFGQFIIDRKGITDRAVLDSMTLMNWKMYPFPLDADWVASLGRTPRPSDRRGAFFKGNFHLDRTADTFFDLSGYQKGYVWVNGHNLGRYWKIGPQQRLYCPAGWLKAGDNRIMILDLSQKTPETVTGCKTLTRANPRSTSGE